MLFKSDATRLWQFGNEPLDQYVKNEPMMFNATLEWAHENGGPITRKFIESLPVGWEPDSIIDSRVHMLMPGWWPCIPGWHHDDVPRSVVTGQPNYVDPEYSSEHILGLVNADTAPTEFLIGDISLELPTRGETIYRVWNDQIDEAISTNTGLQVVQAESQMLYQFDCNTFHRGTQCVKGGWRWFGRVSRNTDRMKSPSNEIRRQVQVYLEMPTMGW